MEPVLAHEVDPGLTYEVVLSKMSRSSSDSIEQRFEIGKLCRIVVDRMEVPLKQLAADTGFSVGTLKRYMDAWDFWGEYRIPGARVVWTTYAQHLGFDRVLGPAWMAAHDYKERLLEGGREAADEMWTQYWSDQRENSEPLSEVARRAWAIRGATQALWNARVQLQTIDFRSLSPDEAKRFADHFRALVGYSQEFRRALGSR